MRKTLLVMVLFISGCGVFKSAARTASDIASSLCELWASENNVEVQLRLSPEAFCDVHENLKPFIDEVLQAKREAGAVSAQKAGLKR